MGEILYREESFEIIGACFEVYNTMGSGFLEAVYQECLGRELKERQVPYVEHPEIRLCYKGAPLEQWYVPDFLCCEKIIVELKAARELSEEHRAQIHNYLRGCRLRLGLLVNFGHYPKLEYERVVL